MKKQVLRKLLVIMAILVLATPVYLAFAGSKNQNTDENGKSVERGTEKINNIDGCRPNEHAGNYWVYIPNEVLPPPPLFHEWEGGPCCPSNILSDIAPNYYPLPNECCNGPDNLPPPFEGGEPAPGNHCLCFAIRGYPDILFE